MSAEKTVAVSYRVLARFRVLRVAAANEHRIQTNMLAALLFQYFSANGRDVAPTAATTVAADICE